jgi:hypothetical protein
MADPSAFLLGGGPFMDKEKHMSHLRNIIGAIEDKGYLVVSIGYEDNQQVKITVADPCYAGGLAFLEKAKNQEGQKD